MRQAKKPPRILFVRVDDGLLRALDAQVAMEQARTPERQVTRAAIVRELLTAALKEPK